MNYRKTFIFQSIRKQQNKNSLNNRVETENVNYSYENIIKLLTMNKLSIV